MCETNVNTSINNRSNIVKEVPKIPPIKKGIIKGADGQIREVGTNCTIEECKKLKQELESDLSNLIATKILEFKNRTGVSVTDIDIQIIENRTLGYEAHYFVSDVKVKTDL